MKSIRLGVYGIPIVFNQTTEVDLTTASVYILYTKPDGTEGQWTATKSGYSFYYLLQDGDIDQIGTWILWGVAIWSDKLLWDRVAFRVKNAPIERIP